MPKGIKITKREMKEDSFVTFMLQAKDYALERWYFLVGALALVLIIIVAVNVVRSEGVKAEKAAAEVYSRALNEYFTKNYQLAIIDFQSVIDNYGSTAAARPALFHLGNAYFGAQNYAEAITAFEKYLEEERDDKVFATSALAGVAACLAATGDPGAAADKYREAADKYPDFPLAGEFLLKAMKHYILAGNLESARVIYARLTKDYSDTPYLAESQRLAGEHKISL